MTTNKQQTTVTLPNNVFGVCIFLAMLALTAIAPFVISFWLIGMIAPLWVNIPCSVAIAIVAFFKIVKFKK
jgi:hypothetical protein